MIQEIITFEKVPFAISEILARVQKIETLLSFNKPQEKQEPDPEPYIYGITGLAEFLKCSLPTAQKIKNSGKVPFSQTERTIIFEKSRVLEALANTKKRKG